MGLGWKPSFDALNLTTGADWIFERTNSAGPFLPATTAEIVWATGQTWAATISANKISWRVESTVADLIPNKTKFTIWIRYPNGNTSTTDDYPWIVGCAQRSQNQ